VGIGTVLPVAVPWPGANLGLELIDATATAKAVANARE
jgi:hypothetical protein